MLFLEGEAGKGECADAFDAQRRGGVLREPLGILLEAQLGAPGHSE